MERVRVVGGWIVMAVVAVSLAACGATGGLSTTTPAADTATATTGLPNPVVASPTLAPPTTPPTIPATPSGAGAYPRYGQAPDQAWIAGQVVVTSMQGSCTYIQYDATDPSRQVHPSGEAWAAAESAGLVPNGAFIVALGHMAGPGEPREMCPGDAYTVDRVLPNGALPPATPAGGPPPGLPSPTVQGTIGISGGDTAPGESPPLVAPTPRP